MLSNTELEDYFRTHNLSASARRVIETVRSSPPSRRVDSGAANVACRFASRKMGVTIQAESHTNELPAVIDWENDPRTYEFYDQPPRIKLTYLDAVGRRRAHMATPDFFLLHEGFTGWVECKTEEWLKAHSREGATLYVPDGAGGWRCPAGDEYAASVGLEFRVRSSAETSWVAVRNAEFLADYFDERVPRPSRDEIERARASMAGQAWIRLKDLLESDHGLAADRIFKMIADGDLIVVIDRDLLCEPERTNVFRDRVAAQAYALHHASRQLPAIPCQEAVHVAAGQKLVWDGVPWRVANVGAEEVYLEGADRVLIPLARPTLEQLVREGKVTGIPDNSGLDNAEADKAVRAASPADFALAVKRHAALRPDPSVSPAAPVACDRTLRKWRARFRRGEQALGSGFLGLLPQLHRRGNRKRKLDDAVIGIMNEVIDELFAQPEKRTLVSCWGEVALRCANRNYPAPSEKTFRKEVRRRRGRDLKAKREGEKAAYDQEEFQWYDRSRRHLSATRHSRPERATGPAQRDRASAALRHLQAGRRRGVRGLRHRDHAPPAHRIDPRIHPRGLGLPLYEDRRLRRDSEGLVRQVPGGGHQGRPADDRH